MRSDLSIPVVSIDPFGDDFLRDPYAFHDQLREAGPLFWIEAYGVFGTARHAEVTAALKDHASFASGRGVGLADFATEAPWRPTSLLLEVDPPLHDRTRGLMNRVAALPRVRSLQNLWQERADVLIESLVRKGRFDAVKDLAEVFPMQVFPDLIGLPIEGRQHLLPYAAATFDAFGPRNAVFERSASQLGDSVAWVAQACLRENLSEDGWGMQVYRAADEGNCTPDEAARLIRSFLTAGLDTTINGIAHLILAFDRFPDQWTLLRERPALINRAVDESLRWDSTVQTFFRTTSRSVAFAGHVIPEGSKILLFLAAANRDPRRWKAPERFDLLRATSGHVGFGHGIHQCLGQMVARQEGEVILRAMLRQIRDIRAAAEPKRRPNNTLHALESLEVIVTRV